MKNPNRTSGAITALGIFTGLLIGSLAGAGAMLLLAPQSGKKTRAKIQEKSIELTDQTIVAVEDGMARAGFKARQIRSNVRKQAQQFNQHGHILYDEPKKNWSSLVVAGEAAVQGTQA